MSRHSMAIGAAFVAALSLSQGAFAQAAKEDTLEEVVVTGTAIRGVAPVGSATVNLTHDDLMQSVSLDPAQFIRDLPQGSGLGRQEVGSANNVGYAQGVNLRGLGTGATLVLFDGHRLVGQGITDQFADPNQLPVSAIERVEIVTDGASAIYGSDAVAGVVNYILRNKYNGLEVNTRYVNTLYKSGAIDILGGKSWGSGNFWIGGLYERRGTFLRNERAYLMQDLRPYGGNDGRLVGTNSTPGSLPNIVANNTIYGVPATNGVKPTAAQILALARNPNLADTADQQWYQPKRDRLAITTRVQQEFLDGRAEVKFTGNYSWRQSRTHEFETSVVVPIASTSPYYIPGLTTTPNAAINLQYSIFLNNGGTHPIETRPVDRSINTALDLRYNLNDNWQTTGFLGYGANRSCGRCGDRVNTSFVNAVALSYPSLFNPWQTGPQQSFLDRAYGWQNQRSGFGLYQVGAKLEGALLKLSGGDVRLAVGGEHVKTTQTLFLDGNTNDVNSNYFVLRDTRAERKLDSAYAEVYVPVVGAGNAMRGIKALNLSLAVRYDKYSDFGNTTNPKIGVTYEPTDSVRLRGSYGTSFRAPTLVESNPGVLEQITRNNYSNGANDPNIPIGNVALGTTSVLQRIGSTPGLLPEKAKVWSVGFDLKPESIKGLQVNATYYSVAYENRIEAVPNLNTAIASPANRQLYSYFITPARQPATCVNGNFATYNPLYLPYVTSPNSINNVSINDCALGAIVLGGNRNLGKLNQTGLDLQASYQFGTSLGDFTLSAAGSKIFKLEKSFLPTDPPVSQLDSFGFQVSKRGNARISWRRGRFTSSLGANYIGDYLNNLTITVNGVKYPDTRVPAWTTLNANLGYSVPLGEGSAFTSGLRLGLSIDNLTNKQPPIVLTNNDAVDLANANVYGRILAFDISKKF